MSSVLRFFPNGLRIIVIDSDEASLNDVVHKLQECKYYTVTPCTKASSALDILNHARGAFDLLLTEFRLPDIDGLSLLQHVREHFDMPIVVMSAEKKTELAVECLNSGACFCLDKPVECSALANIWQHAVVTRRPNVSTDMREIERMSGQRNSCSATRELNAQGKGKTPVTSLTEELPAAQEEEEHDQVEKANAGDDDEEMAGDSVHEEDNGQEDTSNGNNDTVEEGKNKVDVHVHNHVDDADEKKAPDGKRKNPKKSRVVWTGELHQLFLRAIEKLGVDKAAPRKIMEIMDRPELTRANVASHLQKFRQHFRRKAEGKEPVTTGRSSRFSMSRRKSVFDSTPNKLVTNFKNQMDTMPKPLAPAPSYSTVGPQPSFHWLSSSSLPSSTMATTYMGFSLTPQPSQPQNQHSLGLGSSTLSFDSQRRANFFGFQSQQGGFSTLPSYGNTHYTTGQCSTPGFSGLPVLASNMPAGSLNPPGPRGNEDNNATSPFLTGGSPLGMAGMNMQSRQPAAAMSCDTKYVGLQLETATGQLGFGQNGSICTSSDPFSQDVAAEKNMAIDYDFLDQFIQGDIPAAVGKAKADTASGKSLQLQASPKQIDLSICPEQHNSNVNTDGSGDALPTEVIAHPENVKVQQNNISVNDFTGIGFDLEDDITLEKFRSLLFDQEDVGVTHAEQNTNFTATGGEQGEGQPTNP